MTDLTVASRQEEETIFKISYDTEATSEHKIDAITLGNSIISMARVIKGADAYINAKEEDLKVEVKANSEGSFVVEFVAYLNSAQINPLTTLGVVATTAGVATVFGAIQQIKSRKIKLVNKEEDGKSTLHLEDDSSIELPSFIADLVVNKDFRKSVEKVISEPLDGATNAKFIIKDKDDIEILSLTDEECKHFKSIPTNIIDEITETNENTTVRFTRVNFNGPSGWKVDFSNELAVSVTMKDGAFLNKISQNLQQFSKADLYSVKLKIVKTHRHGKQPTYNRAIIEVIRNVTQSQAQS